MNDTHNERPPTGPSGDDDRRPDVDRFWKDLLAQAGITEGHETLFRALDYGFNEPPEKLPARAEAEHNLMVGRDVVTADECRAALADCLDRGWLQIIDQRALDQISEDLRASGVIGPLTELPPIGGVDYTATGADFWHSLCEQRWLRLRYLLPACMQKPFVAVDCVWLKTAYFYPSLAAARRGIEEFRRYDDVVSIAEPVAIGPWRAQWWRYFPTGYRVDIVQTAQGGRVICNEHVSMHWPRPADIKGLREVLDRHNVTGPEWLMLWAIDEGISRSLGPSICPDVIDHARRVLRVKFPAHAEEKCRQGLETCLCYGWLRVAGADADAESEGILEREPAFLAVPDIARRRRNVVHSTVDLNDPTKLVWKASPENSHWGDLDFSVEGAQLYRAIVAEWLGADWEDEHLHVEHQYHWKEHHYSESTDGFADQIQEHLAYGRVIVSHHEVPIGPWCTDWTHYYPAGYRMELELRTPAGLNME